MDDDLFDVDLFLRLLQSVGTWERSELNPPTMSRAKHWCFTLNNYTTAIVDSIVSNQELFQYIVFGKEIGESGTPHLQGFVSFPNKVRMPYCIETIGQAHFSVARNIKNSIEYCKKDGDFIELGTAPSTTMGTRTDLESFKIAVASGIHDMKQLRADHSETVAKYPKFCLDFLNDNLPKKYVEPFPLRLWQQMLYDELRLPPDSRKILFMVDPTGNAGKSWFAHYYCQLHDNSQVLLPGKKADMSFALNPLIRVLFVDAPRSKQADFIQYDFLEDVKNGYVFCSKYESRVKHMDNCHVVVMMNEPPDMNKLSQDRYRITNI